MDIIQILPKYWNRRESGYFGPIKNQRNYRNVVIEVTEIQLNITFYQYKCIIHLMFPRPYKILILICILIGIYQTTRANVHAGTYIIQQVNAKIPDIHNYRINVDDQSLSISGGCNRLSTNYQVHNEHITYKGWTTTQMFCEVDHDQEVVKLFESASKISAFGGKIYFYNSQGQKVMKLKRLN